MPQQPVEPRLAATVVLLSTSETSPFEVLLARRHPRSGFGPGAWVFPGGVVEAGDRTLDPSRWRGIDLEELSTRFREAADVVLGLHVAAVRETFEEVGVLLGWEGPAPPERPANSRRFAQWLSDEDVVLELDQLVYWSRWITPLGSPKRYDTAFFVALSPIGQRLRPDRRETTAEQWISPDDALEAEARGDLELMHPTRCTLEELSAYDDVDDVFAASREIPPTTMPYVTADGRILNPGEPGYPSEPGYPAALRT